MPVVEIEAISPPILENIGTPEELPIKNCPAVGAVVTSRPDVPFPYNRPLTVSVFTPVPPCATDKGVVKPLMEVMVVVASVVTPVTVMVSV